MTESPRSLFNQLNTIAELERLIAGGRRVSETKSASKLFGDQDYADLFAQGSKRVHALC
jgi:hypothetical protein